LLKEQLTGLPPIAQAKGQMGGPLPGFTLMTFQDYKARNLRHRRNQRGNALRH